MSIEAMALVLNHSSAKGTAKVVLLGIANHDGDGGAWPAVATLARYANVDSRTVRRAIRELVAASELHVSIQAGGLPGMADHARPNRYDVLVRCPEGCDGSTKHLVRPPDAGVRGGAGASVTRGVTSASAEPSLNRPDESSVGSIGSSDGSPLRGDRAHENPAKPKRPKPKRKPLTPEQRRASWHRFRDMDLGDLDDDIDIRAAAFLELEKFEGAFEPDRWAQAKIDEGTWDSYCASRDLGQVLEVEWNRDGNAA